MFVTPKNKIRRYLALSLIAAFYFELKMVRYAPVRKKTARAHNLLS